MNDLLADFRYAFRRLRHSSAFTLTAVLTLALGIGATTAIFTLVQQIMLRPLPVPHAEQLYKLGKQNNCCVWGGLHDEWNIFPYDFYRSLREQTSLGEKLVAVQAGTNVLSIQRAGDADTQSMQTRLVSGNYFSVLGVVPFAGRLLREDDDQTGASPSAVISYQLWRRKFAANPHLVGSTLLLTGHPFTVVGIAAPDFIGERNQPDAPGIWLPLSAEPTLDPDRPLLHYAASEWLDLLIRIPDPKRVAPIQLGLANHLRRWITAHSDAFGDDATSSYIARQTILLSSASTGINSLRDRYGDGLRLLMFITGFVLLIACANLANLMLVRGITRKQELAIRGAMGAPRMRLVRQMLAETALLALAGGLAAIVVAYVGTRAILALVMRGVESSPISATPSLPVLGFALAVTLLTGVLFGIAPAWIASRTSPIEALRGANRSTRDASALPQKLLVVLQAALALVLLSTGGLLLTSLRHLEHQDFHFDTHGRLILLTDLRSAGYTVARLPALYQQFDDRLAHLPGVVSLAYTTYGPMTGADWNTGVYFPGLEPHNGRAAIYNAVSPHYFQAIGTPLLQGRSITEQDTATSVHVAVVNRSFVEKYLAGVSPLGVHFGPDPKLRTEFEIVGVVEDAKYGDAHEDSRPMFFSPLSQTTIFANPDDVSGETAKHFAANLVIQYQGNQPAVARALRSALHAIDPQIPILQLLSYDDQLNDNFSGDELVVRLTELFGALALLLAAVGLYGTTAHSVAQRTSEIGIRMALGASRGGVLSLIMRGALTQTLLGLAIGLPLSLLAARLLAHTLYQTAAFQPILLLGVILLLAISTGLAAVFPARRAASVDPNLALRLE